MASIGTDTFFAPLSELNASLKAGEFSAEDLARAFSERLQQLGPRYNALALPLHLEALRLKPGYAMAYNNLGVALTKKGQFDAGISQFQEALRLKPDYAEAHYNFGNALVRKGQID